MKFKGYCVLCNRGRPKGGWKKVELQNHEINKIQSSRGEKFQARGDCPVCGKIITVFIKKPVQEDKNGNTKCTN